MRITYIIEESSPTGYVILGSIEICIIIIIITVPLSLLGFYTFVYSQEGLNTGQFGLHYVI